MNRNYSSADKKIRIVKYVHEHHACDKNNVGYENGDLSTINLVSL